MFSKLFWLLAGMICFVVPPIALCVQESTWEQYSSTGMQAYKEGHYVEAEKHWLAALEKAQAFGDKDQRYAASLNSLAELYFSRNQYSKAEPLFQRSLKIWEEVLGPEHQDVAVSLNNLAFFYKSLGHYTKAEPLYQRSLTVFEKVFGLDHPNVVASLKNLAFLYKLQGHYIKAIPLYQRLLAVQKKVLGSGHLDVAHSLNNLAELYLAHGQYAKSEPLYQRSLAIREKVSGSEHRDVAQSLNNLAELYRTQGQYEKAEPLYQRSLAILEKVLDPENPYEAIILNNYAELYRIQGQYTKAELLLKRSLAVSEKVFDLDHPNVGTSLNNLANLYYTQDQYSKAKPLIQHSLKIFEKVLGLEHPKVALSLNNLANVYNAQGQYSKAGPLYHRSLVIREKVLGPTHPDIAQTLYNLSGLFYRQGQYTKALTFAQKATAIHRGRLVPQTEDLSEGGLHEQVSNRSQFIYYIQLISKVIEAQPDRQDVLTSEAFEISQLTHATRVAQAIAQMAMRSATGDPQLSRLVHTHQDAINQWRALNAIRLKRLTNSKPASEQSDVTESLNTQLASLEERIQSHKIQLRHQFPAYAELNDPQPATLSEIQQLLAPDEALLVYVVGSKVSFLWVVRSDKFAMHRLETNTDSLTQAVNKLRQAVNKSIIKPFNLKLAHQLYSQLVEPAKPLLEGVNHIFITADSALQGLPFATLITDDPKTTFVFPMRYPQLPWLGKRYAFTTLPGVSSLKGLRRIAKSSLADKPFIGFGAPTLKGKQKKMSGKVAYTRAFRGALADIEFLRELLPLPETVRELKNIARYLNAGDENLYLGDRATESQLKSLDLSTVRILAFSTHGLLAREVKAIKGSAEPALVLTPPSVATERDDGLLTASEVAQLKLDADWVILSACNTASSNNSLGGEGLSELARAFFYAGSRSLLVSHWYVESTATSKLMIGMFEQLAKNSNMRRAEALQMAMLKLINDTDNPHYAHPIYWAPFVIVGEGGAGL